MFIYILLLDLIMVMWSQYGCQHIVLSYNICSNTPKCPSILVVSFACASITYIFMWKIKIWFNFFINYLQLFYCLCLLSCHGAHEMLFLFEKLLVIITYFQTQKGNLLLCISSILSLISGQHVWEVWLRCDGDPGGRYSPRHRGLAKLR